MTRIFFCSVLALGLVAMNFQAQESKKDEKKVERRSRKSRWCQRFRRRTPMSHLATPQLLPICWNPSPLRVRDPTGADTCATMWNEDISHDTIR